MPYTLFRGNETLGRVEMHHLSAKGMSGYLVPRDGDVSLRSETQMHMLAFTHVPAKIVSMPEEPEVVDGPPHPSEGQGALTPPSDDMEVAPGDELRLLENDEAIRATSVWLREKRYLRGAPAELQLQLPAGALRGSSFWEVTVFLDTRAHHPSGADDAFADRFLP
jgi:hypothetical protein